MIKFINSGQNELECKHSISMNFEQSQLLKVEAPRNRLAKPNTPLHSPGLTECGARVLSHLRSECLS